MNLLTTILLGLSFVAIFCFLICKLKVFRRLGLAPKWLLLLFATKLVAAFALVGVYKIVYENENTGDINKYHKAGLVLYSAMEENPADYFKMVSGICADEPQLECYYDKADYWYKAWNYGLLNDNRTIIRYNALLDLFTQGNHILHFLGIEHGRGKEEATGLGSSDVGGVAKLDEVVYQLAEEFLVLDERNDIHKVDSLFREVGIKFEVRSVIHSLFY